MTQKPIDSARYKTPPTVRLRTNDRRPITFTYILHSNLDNQPNTHNSKLHNGTYTHLSPNSVPAHAQAKSINRSLLNLQLHNPTPIHQINTTPAQPTLQPNPQTHSLTPPLSTKQVQTPQQRRANEAFAKSEAAKRGKPQTEIERLAEKKKAAKAQQKSPVSKVWLCKFLCMFLYRLVGRTVGGRCSG